MVAAILFQSGALQRSVAAVRLAVRNGAFSVTNNTPENLRSAYRNRNTAGNRNNNLGFRAGSSLSARAGATKVRAVPP